MNTSVDSLYIEIGSTAKESTASVDRLIQRLDALRNSLQNVIKESGNFSQLKNALETASRSASSKATQPKGFISAQAAATDVGAIGDLGDSKYAKLKSTITSTNGEIQKFVLNNNNVLTITRTTKNGVDNYTASMKKLGDQSKKTNGLLSLFNKGNLKLGAALSAGALLVKRLATGMAGYVKEAANYEESMNLFMVTMGDKAKEAKEWVDKFSNALYLDPANVMQYMGSFNALTKGLGVSADNAYIMSKNLTQLTYDLASFKNLDIETAFRKIQSATSGEIEPLRNVGVALSQATLQELALSMGIEKRVADMSEAEKAQLRYIQIIKSTSDWQTDMARTIVTPANALRILKQQFTLLTRAIGSVFIPILMELVPYIMVVTQALTALAKRIAEFFGYEIQDVDYGRITDGLSGISDGITDIGDSAAKTTKKLNTMLAPFDELNVVQNKVESAGGGSGAVGAGGDLGLPLPEYDALAGLSDKLAAKMDEAKQKLKDFLPIIATIGSAFAIWEIGKSVANFMKWWDGLTTAGKTTARIALGISLVVTGLGLSFKGNKDVLDENKLVQAVAEQIGGAATTGLGAGLITKNVYVGLFVGLSLLGFSGSKTASHGDWKQGITGFMEQGLSIAGITGLAFKVSGGNPIVTLAVAALVTWANVLFDAAELAKLKPTGKELWDAMGQLPWAIDVGEIVVSFLKSDFKIEGDDTLAEKVIKKLGPLLTVILPGGLATKLGNSIWQTMTDGYDKLVDKASKSFTDIGNSIGDFVSDEIPKLKKGWDDLKKDTSEKWEDIKKSISDRWSSMKSDASSSLSDLKGQAAKKWDEMKSDASSKWESTKSIVSTKWNDMKNAASDKFQGIKDKIKDKWNSAKTWLSNNIGSKKSWSDKFKGILDGAGDILGKLKNKFSNWKAKLKTPHIKWDSNGTKTKGALKKVLDTLNLPTTLPKLSVSWYAQGGFPKDGEFFVANENGPEMIGKIGNRSAVANNDQIETSLTNALITALNNYNFGGNNSPTTIYIGNKKVYEGYGDYVNGENDRYGTNTIRI